MLSKGLTAATAASSGAARRVCQVHQCFGNHASTSLTQQLCSRSQESGPAAYPYTIDHKAVASRGLRAFGTRMVVACAADAQTVELEVKVEGMKCGGCSSRVEAALKAMDHVKGVQVDLDTKLATVEVEAPNLIDAMNMLPEFVKTIKELGFEAEPHIEYQA